MNIRMNPVTSVNNKIGFGMSMEFLNHIPVKADDQLRNARQTMVIDKLINNQNIKLHQYPDGQRELYSRFEDIHGGKIDNPLDEKGTTHRERIIANICELLGLQIKNTAPGDIQKENALNTIKTI